MDLHPTNHSLFPTRIRDRSRPKPSIVKSLPRVLIPKPQPKRRLPEVARLAAEDKRLMENAENEEYFPRHGRTPFPCNHLLVPVLIY